MATPENDKDDHTSLLEGQNVSLLDIVEERNRTLNKKTLVHRLVIAGKMVDDVVHESLFAHYEKLFKDLQYQYQVEAVTGLMLVFQKHTVQVIESSIDVLLAVVSEMKKQCNDTSEPKFFQSARILVNSRNIPHRLYQSWSERVIDIEAASRLDTYEPTEEDENLVQDILTQLLKLGALLYKTPKTANSESIHENHPGLIPQQEVLAYLLDKDKVDCIIELDSFIDTYVNPFDVVLQSELVWPMPVRAFSYK